MIKRRPLTKRIADAEKALQAALDRCDRLERVERESAHSATIARAVVRQRWTALKNLRTVEKKS